PETDYLPVQVQALPRPSSHVRSSQIPPGHRSPLYRNPGTRSFSIHGARFTLGPGQQLTIPARTAHCLWNAGEEEAHLLVEFRPGLLKQEFSETTFGLARDARHHLRAVGNMLQWPVLAAAYRS